MSHYDPRIIIISIIIGWVHGLCIGAYRMHIYIHIHVYGYRVFSFIPAGWYVSGFVTRLLCGFVYLCDERPSDVGPNQLQAEDDATVATADEYNGR